MSTLRVFLSLLFLSACAATLLVLTGCASTDSQPPPLPWNAPAEWERGGIGIPM